MAPTIEAMALIKNAHPNRLPGHRNDGDRSWQGSSA